MSDDLLATVHWISVHQLTNEGAASLVLHSSLDQIDWIDGSSSHGYKEIIKNKWKKLDLNSTLDIYMTPTASYSTQSETICTFKDLTRDTPINRYLHQVIEYKYIRDYYITSLKNIDGIKWLPQTWLLPNADLSFSCTDQGRWPVDRRMWYVWNGIIHWVSWEDV